MKAAEAQGKFRYVPRDEQEDDTIQAPEKEKPIYSSPVSAPMQQRPPFESNPFTKLTKPVSPPPLVPSPATQFIAPKVPAPVAAPVPNANISSLLSDDFMDPELDLELEGIQLDMDVADINLDEDLLDDD
jgi:cell division protein FtsN